MKVCFATSECSPFVKTGGLADVSSALPKALSQLGCQVKVILPLYGCIDTAEHDLVIVKHLKKIPVQLGNKSVVFNVWQKREKASGVKYYFVDCPEYYHRSKIYTSDADEDERFILFQDAIIKILQYLKWAPDIIHCNDWQTSLLPVYLKEKYHWDQLFAGTKTVLTIHNIGYQGKFSPMTLYKAGLPDRYFYPMGPFEFYGTFSFLKTGIIFADIINTVSKTYAREIQAHDYGAGLEGVLQMRKGDLYGILNGIDNTVWNPRTDPCIPFHYNLRSLKNKAKDKQALLQLAKLRFNEKVPTVGIISRLAEQKGFDLLRPIFHRLMAFPIQLVVLGTGEHKYEDFFRWAAQTYSDKIYAHLGFNNKLAHLITAGCDMFLMPSRYEPSGLNQMYSLNYGTLPIVRKTGGLADTVRDFHECENHGNGFSFKDYTPASLLATYQRAIALFPEKAKWKEMMKRGMKKDFSWRRSAKKYLELYQKAKQKFN